MVQVYGALPVQDLSLLLTHVAVMSEAHTSAVVQNEATGPARKFLTKHEVKQYRGQAGAVKDEAVQGSVCESLSVGLSDVNKTRNV